MTTADPDEPEAPRERTRWVSESWRRHRRTFWILHSLWALATGTVVLWLAHERYGFVPWVVGFLALTWLSTLFFSRREAGARGEGAAGFGHGVASYLTRVMYQETLFFLLPFYWYSTVVPSWNIALPLVMAGLAVLSCLDLVFDRWLRWSPVFGLVFFVSVAFAALNLLLPMLLSIGPALATPAAAAIAVASAVPLAVRGGVRSLGSRVGAAAAALAILAVALRAPQLVPPVPLRLETVTFARDLDRATLATSGVVSGPVETARLPNGLVVVANVFAPANVPARVALDWYRDGRFVRSSRDVRIVAHADGFRFWEALRPTGGPLPSGTYRVILRTVDHRIFGTASIELR
ncbi:MAG: DUF5924 family protein [Vicinamibacterales bacterium]